MTFRITWEDKGLHALFGEFLDMADVEAVNKSLLGNIRFDDIEYMVWDLADVAFSSASEEDFNVIAHIDHNVSRHTTRLANIFITDDPKLVRLITLYIEQSQRLNTPWALQIFSTRQEAKAWLAERYSVR